MPEHKQEKVKEIKDTFEFQFDSKTYITKKMNNSRYGRVIEKVNLDIDVTSNNALHLFMKESGVIIWDFLRNEDKKDLIFEDFEDELSIINSNVYEFFVWVMKQAEIYSKFIILKNDQARQGQDQEKK